MATQRYYFLQFLILAFIIILILVVLVFILVYRCASKAKQNEIDSLKGGCETSIIEDLVEDLFVPAVPVKLIITVKSEPRTGHNSIAQWSLLIYQPVKKAFYNQGN